MARNAKNSKVEVPYLRLVKKDEEEFTEQDVQEFKSKFAKQINAFADDLDAQIEMIKNWG